MHFHFPIISGRKLVIRELGAFNDFCPVCRERVGFRAMDYGTEEHLYYVSLGMRRGSRHVVECRQCKVRHGIDDALPLVREKPDEMRRRLAPRLELEERVRSGSLAPEERAALLSEPIAILCPMVYFEQAYGGSDASSRIGCYGGVAVVAAVGALAPLVIGMRPSILQDVLGWAGVGVVAAVFVLQVYLWRTHLSRYVRRELEPLAARSLSVLKPTAPELREALQSVRESDPVAGWLFNTGRLLERLEAARR